MIEDVRYSSPQKRPRAALTLLVGVLAACGGESDAPSARRDRERTWSAPQTIGSGHTASLGVSSAGDGVAAWVSDGEDGAELRAAVRRPGRGWESPRRLAVGDPSALGATPSIELAMASSGRSVVAWRRFDRGDLLIEAVTHDPAGGWSEAEPIARLVTGSTAVRVAANDAGDAIVGWTERTRNRTRFHPADGGWDAASTVHEWSGPGLSSPRLALDPQGGALAVWVGPPFVVSSAVINNLLWSATAIGGIWSEPEPMTGGAFSISELGMDGAGRALLLGGSFIARIPRVHSRRYEPGFGWESVRPPRTSSYTSSFGELDVARDGSAIAAFFGSGFSPVFYQPGSGWAVPTQLSPTGGDASVAMGEAGEAWAAWTDDGKLLVSHFRADTGWRAAVEVAAVGACPDSAPYSPRIGADGRGGAVVVWGEGGGCGETRAVRASSFE